MLVQGLNDTEQALHEIATLLGQIKPDAVHINLPTRPPAEPWVQPPDEEGLMRAVAILGNSAQVVHPAEGRFDLAGHTHVVDALLSILTRHPMREEELRQTLEKWTPGQADDALAQLAASGQARIVERYGRRFWSAALGRYPDKAHGGQR
jgi:wyosine [tRNA(Phe)-imidazoG37] synthetase (radical SAM superfamily)